MANKQPELVGRTSERAELESLLDRSERAEPTFAFVEGEAGIGKTRLLQEVGDTARARGGLVLRGGAPPPAGQPLPFAAISQVLRDILRQLSEPESRGLVAAVPQLAHLQLAWRLPESGPTAPSSLTSLCEGFLDVVDRIAMDRPLVVLVLDDLQWADLGTLDLITYVVRSSREARVTLLAAARLDETPMDSAIRRVRAELLRSGGVSVRLSPLSPDAVDRLLEELSRASLSRARRQRIAALGRGNPLFIGELIATDEGGAPDGLPETLVALAESRLASLTPRERDTLGVISVASEGVPTDLVLDVLGGPDEATVADIRRLLDARLLRSDDDGRVSAAHPLIRAVVVEGMVDAERRRYHRAIARALAAESGSNGPPETERLVRLAEHWYAAGDRLRALPALARAAEAAEKSYAFTTAFDLYRRTLQLLDVADNTPDDRPMGFRAPTSRTDQPDGRHLVPSSSGAAFADLRRRAADAAILAGESTIALEWVEAALRDLGPSPARDELELARARALVSLGDVTAAVDAYRHVIERSDEPPTSAQIGLARALVASGRPVDAVAVGQTALTSARAGRSRTQEWSALLVLGTALVAAGDIEQGAQRLQEAQTVWKMAPSGSVLSPSVSRVIDLTGGLAEAARVVRAAGLAQDAVDLAQEAGSAAGRWGAEGASARIQFQRVVESFHAGRWDDALRNLDELVDRRAVRLQALTLRARIAALRGSWDRAATDLSESEGPELLRCQPQDRALFSTALTDLRLGRRQYDAAITAATEGLVLARDAPIVDRLEVIALAVRSHVEAGLVARALRANVEAVEHEDVARALLAEVERSPAESSMGIALTATIRAEVLRFRPDDGQAWGEVGGAWEEAGSAWWTVYADVRQAEVLLGVPTRREAARDVLRRAHRAAQSLQASPLLAEIESLAARARVEVDVATRSSSEIRPERKLPISDRELEVLVLVARGLTNKEIASELFISERTAAHHVGHILDKLGVSTRVEAAGIAHRAGLLPEAEPG